MYLTNCLAYIRLQTGLNLSEEKMIPQLEQRMIARNLSFPWVYHQLLHTREGWAQELKALSPHFTNGETYFFRTPNQIERAGELIQERLNQGEVRPFRIWSAGCSTGEEAYSLAITMEELKEKYPHLDYQIVATDLDESRLAIGRRGLYRGRTMKRVSGKRRKKYFQEKDRDWEVLPSLRKKVHFLPFNLANSSLGQLPCTELDLIFCRNVFIYFYRQAMVNTLDRFSQILHSEGSLFLGPAESIHFLTTPFTSHRRGSVFFYQHKKSSTGEDSGLLPAAQVG